MSIARRYRHDIQPALGSVSGLEGHDEDAHRSLRRPPAAGTVAPGFSPQDPRHDLFDDEPGMPVGMAGLQPCGVGRATTAGAQSDTYGGTNPNRRCSGPNRGCTRRHADPNTADVIYLAANDRRPTRRDLRPSPKPSSTLPTLSHVIIARSHRQARTADKARPANEEPTTAGWSQSISEPVDIKLTSRPGARRATTPQTKQAVQPSSMIPTCSPAHVHWSRPGGTRTRSPSTSLASANA